MAEPDSAAMGAPPGRRLGDGQQRLDLLAEALVEHPQHDPDLPVHALRAQCGVDVGLVVAVHQGYPAGGGGAGGDQCLLGDAGVLQHRRHPVDPFDARSVVPAEVRHDRHHRDLVVLDEFQDQPVGQGVAPQTM
nr:hypothetical protein [Kitasatospora acidiphila]